MVSDVPDRVVFRVPDCGDCPRGRESPVLLYSLRRQPCNGDPRRWGGGRSSTLRYHPLIRIHASFTRGGSNVSRTSTSTPTVSALTFLSAWMLARIFRPNSRSVTTSNWFPKLEEFCGGLASTYLNTPITFGSDFSTIG